MTNRISREQAQNFPVYSALDRARDRRNSIKENFEKEEAERRSVSERPNSGTFIPTIENTKHREVHARISRTILEQGAIPVNFKWAEATLEEMRGKKQGRYNTYSDDQKELLISVIQAIRYTTPSHTWAMVAGIIESQLKVGMTAATASGWMKNISPLFAYDSDMYTNLHFMPDEVGVTKNKNKLELRKYAASTYLYYRALKFTADTSTKLVNALYGTDVTSKFLRTIDTETGDAKASKQKEESMITEVEDLAAPLEREYEAPPVIEPQESTNVTSDDLMNSLIKILEDRNDEISRLEEQVNQLLSSQVNIKEEVESEFNKLFADDHEAYRNTIEVQRKSILRQDLRIEQLEEQLSKMQSTNNEGSGVVNKLTNLVSRNRKEN